MDKALDLYSDYLHTVFGQATATGLSGLTDGAVSHDRITRMLSGDLKSSKDLRLNVKPLIREYESDDGCLIFDDTIIEKQHTDESELICWHRDHSKGRNIKGVNLLTAFYRTENGTSDSP